MRKRILLSALGALSLVAVCLTATPIQHAEATPPPPIALPDMMPPFLMANEDGSINVSSCEQQPTSTSAGAFIDTEGAIRSTLPGSNSGYKCLLWNQTGFESGVHYATRKPTSTTQELVAWKNGRQVWAAAIPNNTTCGLSGDKDVNPTNLIEGADGNLYMLLQGATACSSWLFGVDPSDGSIEMSINIGSGTKSKLGLWTYDDRIMVVTHAGVVREFDYDGVENPAVIHSFPVPTGHSIQQLAASDDGTIYGMTYRISGSDSPRLMYYNADDTDGHIPDANTSSMLEDISLTASGDVVGRWSQPARLDYFDISTETVTPVTPAPLTTGYSKVRLDHYSEDADGNRLYIWDLQDNTGANRATTLDVYDASTSTTGTVYTKEVKAGNVAYPSFYMMNVPTLIHSVQDGSLYLAACIAAGCDTSDPSSEIYEIDLGDFGTPVGKGYKRNNYESTKLEYVAMGDSYSSGEGNPDYNPWTNDVINKCHRSEIYSFPKLLTNDIDLNLDLVDFVACSGATTDTVLLGGTGIGVWDEPSQLSALNDATDVVTITIGGNDMGFAQVLEACVRRVFQGGWGCKDDTYLTNAVSDRLSALQGSSATTQYEPEENRQIHSIGGVIAAIAAQSPGVKILIGGYPRLFGSDIDNFDVNEDAPGGATCAIGIGANISYADAQWLNTKADDLNEVIDDAASIASTNGIDVTYVSPLGFNSHRFCDISDEYFIPVYLDENNEPSSGSLHPDNNGILFGYSIPFAAWLD